MTNFLSDLKPSLGSRHRKRRLGKGHGSGKGKHCGKGDDGQRARSGDGKMNGFEGGQTPLLRRVPKRGFTNGKFRVEFQTVSVADIERVFKNKKDIDLSALKIHGLIKGRKPDKLLGGEISSAHKVSAHAFSAGAKTSIEKAGGATDIVRK